MLVCACVLVYLLRIVTISSAQHSRTAHASHEQIWPIDQYMVTYAQSNRFAYTSRNSKVTQRSGGTRNLEDPG